MAAKLQMGKIIFINHDKDYVTIEYLVNGKAKTINGNISEKEQLQLKAAKIIRKLHRFHVGDEVNFIITPSARGDRQIASQIQFRYNNALDSLVNKSAEQNRFTGYLKKTDDGYFVKETGSYIFFPLKLSKWEIPPQDISLNEPIDFSLHHTGKQDKAYATLYRPRFIPEFQHAMQLYKKATIIDSRVSKISPTGIFVEVAGERVQAKIPFSKPGATEEGIKPGDIIRIRITHLSGTKIVVERVDA